MLYTLHITHSNCYTLHITHQLHITHHTSYMCQLATRGDIKKKCGEGDIKKTHSLSKKSFVDFLKLVLLCREFSAMDSVWSKITRLFKFCRASTRLQGRLVKV